MFDSAAWMKMFSFWRTLTFLLKQIFFQLIHKVIEDNIIRRCWIERHFFSACCCASLFSDPISLLLRDKNSWLAAVETLRNISLSISFIVFSEKVILWKVKKGFQLFCHAGWCSTRDGAHTQIYMWNFNLTQMIPTADGITKWTAL